MSHDKPKIIKKLRGKRELRQESRFPLVSALFATFGVVAVFYGFEKIIDRIDFLANHPIVLLISGLVILIVTGTVYKKLN